MFDMQGVGQRIAARRKALNMTQMALADAMGVSFQAVSNWERGRSMPDIDKLPELAQALGLSIDELLTNEKPMRLVQHILQGDEAAYIAEADIAPADVAEVAPLLAPQQTERIAGQSLSREKAGTPTLGELVPLAPYVSDDFLHSWAQSASVDDLGALVAIAPFLSNETLHAIAARFTGQLADAEILVALAPFLHEADVDSLAARLSPDGISGEALSALAPHLSQDALGELAGRLLTLDDIHAIDGLLPFLSEAAIDRLLRNAYAKKPYPIQEISGWAPFIAEETLDWLAKSAKDTMSPDDVQALAPFLSREAVQACAEALIARHGIAAIRGLMPFL